MQTELQTPISRLLAWTEHSPNAICSSPKFDQRGFSLKRSCEEQGMPNDGKAQSVRLALSASPDGSIIWRPSVNANGQESICLPLRPLASIRCSSVFWKVNPCCQQLLTGLQAI